MVAVVGAFYAGLDLSRPDGYQRAAFHGTSFHHRGGFRGRFRGQRLFYAFDTDKDDVLTQAEVDKARGDQFTKFDADGNGSLNLNEYEAFGWAPCANA